MSRPVDRIYGLSPSAAPTPWGRTLVVSMVLHVAGFVLAVGIPRLAGSSGPSPVYVVDLVSLPAGPANASPPPAAAAPAKAAPPPAPREEKAIKLPDRDKTVTPKKTPEPKATPKPQPGATPKASATPAHAVPTPTETHPDAAAASPEATPSHGASMSGVTGGTGAAGGGFGGTGAAQADAESFYLSLVKRNIENAWKKPIYPPADTGNRAYTTQIHIVLTSSGRVASATIVLSSGYDAMDKSVVNAVHDAMFPPFPSTLGRSTIESIFEMVLTRD